MKDKILRSVLILSLILNLSFITAAAFKLLTRRTIHDPCSITQGNHVFEKLDLDEAHQKNIQRMAVEFHENLDRMGTRVTDINKQLIRSVMETDAPDEKIKALLNDVTEKQKQIQEVIIYHLYDIKKELNENQRKVFFQLIEDAFVNRNGHRINTD